MNQIKYWLNVWSSPVGCTAIDAKKLKEINFGLAQEWADADSHIERACLDNGLTKEQVYGDSYGVPTIEEKVDMLVEKLKNEM